MNGNVIRTITIRGTSEGLDKLEADIKKVAAAEQNVAVVSEQAAKSSLTLEQSMARLERRFVEGVRAQQDYEKIQRQINTAVAQNPALQERANAVLAAARDRYDQVSTSAKQMITGMSAAGDAGAVASTRMVAGMSAMGAATGGAVAGVGLARHELINLGRQAQDVGVSLVSGQSPLMVLAQQGTQIADVFISSGKSVGSFFSQAIGWGKTFFTSTAGIVTGIAAIGAAAVYAASQFVRASTTIEQALENQNRLLKEGRALIDQRTSAEARAQLNPRDLTEYELKRNLLDVQRKLNEETRGALIRTAPRPIAGDIVRGEIAGNEPLTPGMEKVMNATAKLKAVQAAGLPGMKEYNAELGRIATTHPELAKTVDKMIELGRTGIELENAEMRLKAISNAMKGVATNAQLAAVGLGSIAQFQLNNRQADDAREATERQAVATLKMAQAYSGMSIEVAKTLSGLKGQLSVAEAVGTSAQIEAQYRATINQLIGEGKSSQEAIAIAEKQRAIALAQIESAHQVTMVSLQGQLSVAQQITGIGQINAQYEATIANLKLQGLNSSQATAQADMQRAIALAQVNAEADRTLRNLQQESQLIRASTEDEKERIKARQTYNNLINQGVTAEKAAAVASKERQNAEEQRGKEQAKTAEEGIRNIASTTDAWKLYEKGLIDWSVANDEAGKKSREMERALDREAKAAAQAKVEFEAAAAELVKFSGLFAIVNAGSMMLGKMGVNMWESKQGGLTQFNPAGYTIKRIELGMMETDIPKAAEKTYGPGGFEADLSNSMWVKYGYQIPTIIPTPQGLTYQTSQAIDATVSGGLQGGGGYSGIIDDLTKLLSSTNPGSVQAAVGMLARVTEMLPEDQQAGSLQKQIGVLQAQPQTLVRDEMIQQLNDKLTQLTSATQDNTAATQSMTDVLSPFYSSDPRRTHLGFRAFAGGGIMTAHGELPLKQYAGGGMATSPQVAVFGEGATPEAYVPVPSGRIPVEVRGVPANSNRQRPIMVNIRVMGNADQATVSALRSTAFQQAQAMRRMMG